MTISELGSLGEVVGAAATVATLLYLAAQIRANTQATRRQALDDTIDRVVQWEARLVGSPELIRAWIDGARRYHGLPTEDQLRFTALLIEILAAIEATMEAAKHGGVKPETVGAVRGMIHQLSRNEGVRQFWETSGRHTFATDFVGEVDRLFAETSGSEGEEPGPLPFHVPAA